MLRSRRGITVAEVLVSLLLGLAVISLAWSALARQRTVASRLRSEMELLAARRLTAIVLGKELRSGVGGRDWTPPSADSFSLRAFRGWGPVCGPGPALGSIAVAYRGERVANPAKDSVVVLTADGWRRADLIARRSAKESCPVTLGGKAEVWTTDPPVTGALVVRVFERGSYHLSGGALRYRRGLGGRQPLTPEVFDDDRSSMEAASGKVIVQLIADESQHGVGLDSAALQFWGPGFP